MHSRHNSVKNTAPQDGPVYPILADPWHTAEPSQSNEQGYWLLSYVDIMTLLFALFVLLFAYQKAMLAKSEQSAKAPTAAEATETAIQPIGWRAPINLANAPILPATAFAFENLPAGPNLQDSFRLESILPLEAEKQNHALEPTGAAMQKDDPQRPHSAAQQDGEMADLDAAPENQVVTTTVSKPHDQFAGSELGQPKARPSGEPPEGDVQMQESAPKTAMQPFASVTGQPTSPANEAPVPQTLDMFAEAFDMGELEEHVDIIRQANEIRLEINDTILFDLASAALKDKGSALLNRLAQVFSRQSGTISIEGHTDNVPISNGQFPSNWELSSARALTVTHYLIAQGIAPNRLRAVGQADTHPRESNDTPQGRAKNRRVSIVIYPPEKARD